MNSVQCADEETKSWPWRWSVAQFGPREHYAVPRALQLTSQLSGLYTGTWCRRGRSMLRRGPAFISSYASHWHPDLPSSSVTSFDLAAMGRAFQREVILRPKTTEQYCQWEINNCTWFGRRTLQALRQRRLDPQVDCFFGFQSECMETLQALREVGVLTILDQASAGQVEDQIADEESRKWPGWTKASPLVPQYHYDRLRKEWKAASLILVNSEWTRQAIIRQGADGGKIIMVPCVFEPERESPPPRPITNSPLTIVSLGRVNVAKGIQYFMGAAALLRDTPHRFVVVGPVSISDDAVKSASSNVEFIGRVPREQAYEWFRKSDIFVFPTLCDGFGMTQIEAMSQAVPVIATPNCGQVVTHGSDGLMVPAGDSRGLADAITQLDQDRGLLAEMSRNAIEKSRQFNLRAYGERVNQAVTRLRA